MLAATALGGGRRSCLKSPSTATAVGGRRSTVAAPLRRSAIARPTAIAGRRCVVLSGASNDSSSLPDRSPRSSPPPLPPPRQPSLFSLLPSSLAIAGAVTLSMMWPRSAAAASPPPPSPTTAAWRDTGIELADADAATKDKEKEKGADGPVMYEQVGEPRWVSPEELEADSAAALSKWADEPTQNQLKRISEPSKGGRPVKDPLKSRVPNPETIPPNAVIEKMELQTAWRPDRLKNLTYTQFWNLVGERQIERARYAPDGRSIVVTTKATAPGGQRTERVGLPYDPDLFDHMVEHGVFIEPRQDNPAMPVLHAILRLAFPVWFSILLIKFAFRLGRKKRDKIFGGVQMESVAGGAGGVTFADVAGVDQVKSEIMEVVAFLKDPQRFLNMGARSPAGVLLVGPPGTGKTLLARAIAGEAGVPFFSIAGTEFMEMFVGVGASRVRDMFQQARAAAPCILFIDEFDGIGKARDAGGGAGNDESVHTINQLLTEMDGFEDNTGVVVMAATNRPAALDQALTRPGRFDRIVQLPLPNQEGRIGILKVHSRDKRIAEDLDYARLARATAGFTGAELMNLMNQAAIVAARQGQPSIGSRECFEALEKIHREKMGGQAATTAFENDVVPPRMRRTIAIYEAARALLGYITPQFDEIQRVSVCPGGLATGYTYFLPQEERLESRITTRSYMESRMVVSMAGRCAERLLLGDANVSTAGSADLKLANAVAREMVYRCGFGRRTGPVALMDNEEVYLNRHRTRRIADISTEMAKIAYADTMELLEAAEAKAYYGLAVNYEPLRVLASRLSECESLTGEEVAQVLEGAGVVRFDNPHVVGYSWGDDGTLRWPGMSEEDEKAGGGGSDGNGAESPASWWAPNSPYMVRSDIAKLLAEE